MSNKTKFQSTDGVMQHLFKESKKGKLIFFCGAGISIKEPTNMPSVDTIVCSVLENLIETAPDISDDIFTGSYIFRNSPFELFMSVIQQGLLFRVFEVLQPLLEGNPNSIHYYLTKLLLAKKVKHIITTNFDDMLESALQNDLSKIMFYYSWREIDKFEKNISKQSIIKLHGSFFNKENHEITTSTILTTTEGIYSSSKLSILKQWADVLKGYTLVFMGYSGRDRLDVIPLLSYLSNSDIIWICHTDNKEIEIVTDIDNFLSKEMITLTKVGNNVTPLTCHTEQFLSVLGEYLGYKYDVRNYKTIQARSNFSISVKGSGFLPPIFPKYSYLVAGYLLLWLGFARQAGYAFSQFHKNCVDEEPRLLSNASCALGQVFENMNDFSNASTSYTIAMRGYWGLGDYASIVKTSCYFADLLMNMKNYDEAGRMARDAIYYAERENYEYGLGLAYYTKAKLFENLNKLTEASNLYSEAINYAVNNGNFWVEAGSRQQLVKVEHRLNNKYSDELIEHLLIALDKIYWIGNGSAPSLKTASLVDPFYLPDALIDSIVEVKGKEALLYIESLDILNRITMQLPTDIKIRVQQKLNI